MKYISVLVTSESSRDFQKQSGLGIVDYIAVTEAVEASSQVKIRKQTYTNWTNKERFVIGKYAAENGHTAAARKFSSKNKPLNESTARRFCKRYKEELQRSTKEKREPKTELSLQPRRRPLMLGSLDEMVQRYIRAYRSRGGPVNSLIAVSIAKLGTPRPRFFIMGKKPFQKNGVHSKDENNRQSGDTGGGKARGRAVVFA